MMAHAEPPTSEDRQAPARRTVPAHGTPAPRARKESLLPEIAELALEGHSGRAVADQTGLPKRTVNHWLRELRREWSAEAAEGAAELFADAVARLKAIYRADFTSDSGPPSDYYIRYTPMSVTPCLPRVFAVVLESDTLPLGRTNHPLVVENDDKTREKLEFRHHRMMPAILAPSKSSTSSIRCSGKRCAVFAGMPKG